MDPILAFAKNSGALIPTDLHDLRAESKKGDEGIVYIYQTHNGLPVTHEGGSDLSVDFTIDPKTGIENISSDYLPHINISTEPSISEDEVITIAKEDMLKNHMFWSDKSGIKHPVRIASQKNIFPEKIETQLIVYVTDQGQPILVYRFDLRISDLVATRYYIDANTGEILAAGDTGQHYFSNPGRGNVFWPNPINALNDPSIRDAFNGIADSKYAVPLAAYVTKPLNVLQVDTNVYALTGPYVRPDDRLELPFLYSGETAISTIGTVRSTILDFFFDRESSQFEIVMVSHVIDANQRYIQSLGFNKLGSYIYNRPLKVDAHAKEGADNSAYTIDKKRNIDYIAFGEGGIDDAEDADIILHEYGHAIQNDQAPLKYAQRLLCNTQAEAMGEGFGDYWQASNTRAISLAHKFDPACYGEWDNAGKGALCRRRVDSKKRFSDYKGVECHADGEIWSSGLWEILTKIGSTEASRRVADQLILQSHFEIRDMKTVISPKFVDGGAALLKADVTLKTKGIFTTSHKSIICTALKTNRGIPVPGC